MSDDDCLFLLEVLDDGLHVANEFFHSVVFDPLRLVAFVIASLIDRHDLKLLRQGWYLVSPGVPVVGKTMNQYQQRPGPFCHIMNSDVV